MDSSISAGAYGAANKAIEQSAECRARVGRVGDHHLSEVAEQQSFVGLAALRIATDQAMPAELPNVTNLGHRWPFKIKTRKIIGRISRQGMLRAVYQ